MLSLFLLLPLVSIIILNLSLKEAMRMISIWCVLFLSAAQVLVVLFHHAGFWERPDFWGRFFELRLAVDNISLVLLLSIGIVVFATALVAWQTISSAKERLNFANLLLISLIGMNGTVLLTDIFSLYIFIEIMAVSSFILISFHRNLNALESAFKYIVLSAVATILMLTAISLLLLVTGETSFASIAKAIAANNGNVLVKAAIGIFICGMFIKGGLVPFHGWLPGVYSMAPPAVSVLLAGIVTKVSGIYALIRLITSVFGITNPVNNVLLAVGVFSILVGAFAALAQDDYKKMLAYSSISQVGYIILALGCGTTLGVVAAVFHLFNHSLFKSLLFVNSAAVEQQTGTTDMNKMGGLESKMPYSNATSLVAVLSAAGVPPLAGFWSKLLIVIALWQSAHYGYAVVAVLASIITLAYLLVIQRRVFFGVLPDNLQNIKEAGAGIILPAVVLAGIIIGVGLFFPMLFNSFMIPIDSFLK